MQPVKNLWTEGLRRSGRVPKEVAILLTGSNAHGKDFIEQTKMVVLSRHGAGIISFPKLAVEQEMTMVDRARDKETVISVVGRIGAEVGSYTFRSDALPATSMERRIAFQFSIPTLRKAFAT